jgi:hypothetical protein
VPPGAGLQGAVAETPEFVVTPPVGPAPDTAGKLAAALAVALREHDIAATTTPTDGARRISATVKTADGNPTVTIDIVWTVTEAGGGNGATIEQRVVGSPEDWFNGADNLVSRIASQAAFRIGRRLGRGDLAHVPIAALPDVGPDSFKPAPGAAPDAPPPGEAGAPVRPAVAAASSAPRVRVLPITGPSGGREMAQAMRRALGESQMVLTDSAESHVFQVQGSIELDPAADGRQRVVVRWTVKRGDGTQIGDLEQANTVRAGALQGNWDKLAPIVALAAVDAVVELIERDRSRAR